MKWNEFRVHVRHLSLRDLPRVMEAFRLGEKAHEGQARKSGEPYFTHPIAVAHILADMGADADTIIAALLHDTLEDTNLTAEEIDQRFDGHVRTLIEGVTKLSQDDVKDRPSLNEQIETLRKMFTLMERDIRIMVIKLVDRLHNMQTTEFLPIEKQRALAKETLEVYVRVADRLCMQDLRDELESLTLAILEPERYGELSTLRTQSEVRGYEVIADMQKRLASIKDFANIRVSFEPKSWENMRQQLETEGNAVSGVSAVTAVLLCPTISDCYKAMGLLHQCWRREVMSFQDYINSPAINGYRGLHTTIILEDGTRVRCKIRTHEMQDYARKGVASFCFKYDPQELATYLPWTVRISPLTQDSPERSQEFWLSLQNDILGDSFVIHGPGNETLSVPQGSTALDGAFYLFHEKALNTKTLRMNGKEVPFSSSLEHGTSLDVTFADSPTVELSWLSQVKSGIATATIRTALARILPSAEKESIGKTMLQETLKQRQKGFIEEFDERSLQPSIQSLGYGTLSELYLAIAEGRVEPRSAYEALFESGSRKYPETTGGETSLLAFRAPLTNPIILVKLFEIYRRYQHGIIDVQLGPSSADGNEIRMRVNFPPDESARFVEEMTKASARTITRRIKRPRISHVLAIGVLLTLWGLDPVLARLLVQNAVAPVDLTIIRFLTFFGFSSLVFLRQRFLQKQQYKPLSPLEPMLLLSGASLFFTGIFTYFTLQGLKATQYILLILVGIAFVNLLRQIRENDRNWVGVINFIALALTTFISLWMQRPSTFYILAGIGSSCSFALYSLVSKRFQDQVGMVRERYPAYLFWISLFCLLLSLPLLPIAMPVQVSTMNLSVSVLFSLVFAVLPYAIYFECMRRIPNEYLNSTLSFVALSTIIGEIAITGTWHWLSLLPLVAIIPWNSIWTKTHPTS